MQKVAVITGGAGGIGSATALTFAREGYAVALCYRSNHTNGAKVADQINALGGVCHLVQADLATWDGGAHLGREVVTRFGRVDTLVCCAGSAHFGLFTDLSAQDWSNVLGSNLNSAVFAIQGVLPTMISQKSGSIVTVSSVWGQTGASCEVAYSAAKAGVIGLTRALAKEVGPSNIRVNCVACGVIDTDMNQTLTPDTLSALAEETPLGRIGTPQEVANTISFLASEKSSFITGQIIAPNGGFYVS